MLVREPILLDVSRHLVAVRGVSDHLDRLEVSERTLDVVRGIVFTVFLLGLIQSLYHILKYSSDG